MSGKLFFIGFNKCGTKSITGWLADAGVKVFHGGIDGTCHKRILVNLAIGRPALQGTDEYGAYLDVQAVQQHFRRLDHDYPGSKFVLNTRPIEHWLVSRLNHLNGCYVTYSNLYYSLDLRWSEWVERWRREFIDHENSAVHYFRTVSTSSFLRFDIETDRPADLAAFLGLAGGADVFPRENVTRKRHYGWRDGRIVSLREL